MERDAERGVDWVHLWVSSANGTISTRPCRFGNSGGNGTGSDMVSLKLRICLAGVAVVVPPVLVRGP
jgi:hypothetical protein